MKTKTVLALALSAAIPAYAGSSAPVLTPDIQPYEANPALMRVDGDMIISRRELFKNTPVASVLSKAAGWPSDAHTPAEWQRYKDWIDAARPGATSPDGYIHLNIAVLWDNAITTAGEATYLSPEQRDLYLQGMMSWLQTSLDNSRTKVRMHLRSISNSAYRYDRTEEIEDHIADEAAAIAHAKGVSLFWNIMPSAAMTGANETFQTCGETSVAAIGYIDTLDLIKRGELPETDLINHFMGEIARIGIGVVNGVMCPPMHTAAHETAHMLGIKHDKHTSASEIPWAMGGICGPVLLDRDASGRTGKYIDIMAKGFASSISADNGVNDNFDDEPGWLPYLTNPEVLVDGAACGNRDYANAYGALTDWFLPIVANYGSYYVPTSVAGTLAIEANRSVVNEGETAQFTVTRVGGDIEQSLTVEYVISLPRVSVFPDDRGPARRQIESASFMQSERFTAGTNVLQFAPGETSKVIDIVTQDDVKQNSDGSGVRVYLRAHSASQDMVSVLGKDEAVVKIKDQEAPLPVALFTPTTSGLTASFNNQSTGVELRYAWTFGDGATSTLLSPTHTYASAGSFTVTLTVTDGNDVTISKTATVVVGQKDAGGGGGGGSVPSGILLGGVLMLLYRLRKQ